MTLIEYIKKRRKLWNEPETIKANYLTSRENLSDFYKSELDKISELYNKYSFMDYENLIQELIYDLSYEKGNQHVVELLAEMQYTQEEIENFGFSEEDVRKVLDYDYLD